MDRSQPELEILRCRLILDPEIMTDGIFLAFDPAFRQTFCIDQLHITMPGVIHHFICRIKCLRRYQDRITMHAKERFDRITPCFVFQLRYIFTCHAGFFVNTLFFQFFIDLADQLRLLLHMRIVCFVAVTVLNDLTLLAAFELHFLEFPIQISFASHNAVTFFTDLRPQCIDGFLFFQIRKFCLRQFLKCLKIRDLALHFFQLFRHMKQTFPELFQLFFLAFALLQLLFKSRDLLSGIIDRFGYIQLPECRFCLHIITVKCIDFGTQFFDRFNLCFHFDSVLADRFFCRAAFLFPGEHISIF